MNLLDYFQNNPPQPEFYIDRKLQLPDANHINLYGVRGSGKSALAVDYLQDMDHETLLYIDCEDPNLLFTKLSSDEMQEYIYDQSIELLILDHYNASIIETVPHAERIIVISRVPLPLEGFSHAELFPLDYEEFLAFDKGSSQTTSFNHFLKLGTMPLMTRYGNTTTTAPKHFIKSKFDTQELYLLTVLATHQTKHITVNQLYLSAKSRFKVSKDWLYKKIKDFKEEGVLYFIEDRYQKGGRKLILFDFAIAKYLTMNHPFITQFDTMVALALIKHHVAFKTLGIHGYITNSGELIIPAPFESEESIWKKSHSKFSLYKKYGVEKVTIVTIANQYNYVIEKIEFEALPFYEWSILNEEELA